MAKQSSKKSERRDSPSWFDKLSNKKKDIACLLALYVVVLLLFGKIIFSNMIFSDSGDTAAAHAWAEAIDHIKATEQVEALWIPYIFSGMPIFATLGLPLDVNYVGTIFSMVGKLLFFDCDVSWIIMHYFMMGTFMFLLARNLGFSQLPSLVAALILMLNPYSIGLAEGGHGSKLITLTYIPLVMFLTINLVRKQNLLNFGLLAVVTGTMFLGRHPQIAFYGMMMAGCYVLYEAVRDLKSQPRAVVKTVILFVIAVAIGFAIYSYEFLPTYEYSKYSIRGGSETGISKGLDYNYATSWSFHPYELITYFIPSFFGYENLYYWGWMPFTNSTVYVGIVPILLAIIAIVYRRNRMTWFLSGFAVFILFISFGKHLSLVYDLMFNYVPYFNKFRVPVMVLHLMPLVVGILSAYGITVLLEMQSNPKGMNLPKFTKNMMTALGVCGAVLVIGFVVKDAFLGAISFQRPEDIPQLQQQVGAQAQRALIQLKQQRADLLWSDFIKMLVISASSIGIIIAFMKRKVGIVAFGLALAAIVSIDLWIYDVKYINPKPNTAIKEQYQADPVVQALQEESDTSLFRVFPFGGFDQGNIMMYNHVQSVEGYSPAKLKIYQDVRDSCFARNNMNVYNMLNVKYFVGQAQQNAQTIIQPNPGMLPRAWFVEKAVTSNSNPETFAYLNSASWDPKTTAILESPLPVNISKSDSTAVTITTYHSREIELKTYSSATSLLVVSEVYYPAGWNAYIDGSETEIYKTNYILRSVVVPAGSHTIQFKFDPPTYQLGYTLSLAGWGVVGLIVLAGLFQQPWIKQRIGFGKKEHAPPGETSAVASS